MVKPGITLAQIQRTARKVIDDAGCGKYFIHGTSHTLNAGDSIDLMNVGTLRTKEPIDQYIGFAVPLEPGGMITVEPGIHIPEKNLGIRIEDSVLVTADGYEALTAAASRLRTSV